MRFAELLLHVADEPVFRTGFLAATGESLPTLRLQLSRWVAAGRLIQLRRGLYTLAPPYRKTDPHPFILANALKRVSYVSLQSALAHYGLIPEHVPTVTSITTQRPERLDTPIGRFIFRHVAGSWFHGFRPIDLAPGRTAFVATPEKALLDLIYLTPHADSGDFLDELRLQNTDTLDLAAVEQLAQVAPGRKLRRAVQHIRRLIEHQRSPRP